MKKTELTEKELIEILEKSEKEKVRSLASWLDYLIDQAEAGYGALSMQFFFQNEKEVLKKVRDEMEPISHRLYVTESIMEAQLEQIVGDNKIWKEKTLELKDFHPERKLLRNSLRDTIVL